MLVVLQVVLVVAVAAVVSGWECACDYLEYFEPSCKSTRTSFLAQARPRCHARNHGLLALETMMGKGSTVRRASVWGHGSDRPLVLLKEASSRNSGPPATSKRDRAVDG